jgi:circadian clock protein KaiC
VIEKIKTGVDFFDDAYSGIYQGRSVLVTGSAGSGKSVLGLQFIEQGLREDARCLFLSPFPAEDITLMASAFGTHAVPAVAAGDFIIMSYTEYVPGRDREDELKLPKESFLQLKSAIEEQGVQRVVLDTVLPWVVSVAPNDLAEHIFSLVRAFQRLGVSSMLTLPKPVSPSAIALRNLIQNVVPISLSLDLDADTGTGEWKVDKYLGAPLKPLSTPYTIEPGTGFVQQRGRPGAAAFIRKEPRLTAQAKRSMPTTGRSLFADAVLGHDRRTSHVAVPTATDA